MRTGGRAHVTGRAAGEFRAALIGLGLTSMVLVLLPFSTQSASGVAVRVPMASHQGGFVFGTPPVRQEVTRRVVATQTPAAGPLSTLFRIAHGVPAPPTHVLTTMPPAKTPPTMAPTVGVNPRPAPFAGVVPPMGKAWAWGCAAAIAYLEAYAAPEFSIECPGNTGGHEATTTCISGSTLCGDGASIVISDPCPASYMNEASNSWVLLGIWSNVPIDPYGQCP